MEFPAHIVFSCLLVCQPAIFVDSKRDGTGAAHGRKGFRMKRAELDRRIANGETLDDIVPALMDDGADITSYDDLKRFAIEKIESDELYLAEHVLKHETDEVELKKISLLIPAWLHKEAQLHRVETGESMTKLIVRLLAEELG